MRKATITEAKNGLSALIDYVRGGETVVIMDRGRPVARLAAALEIEGDDEGRLARLERSGAVLPGKGGTAFDISSTPPPAARDDARIVEVLLEERRRGR